MFYNEAETIDKESLVSDQDFLVDASTFLAAREGYDAEDLQDPEDVYDAFMEHFRYQNVNEVTALRDLAYAQSTDDLGRERMGRLMSAFDKMDSDLGLAAAGDYLGGVFTAPSTYAGLFSFGAGKAGALAANQTIKFGIRQALAPSLKRAGLQTALIDAPATAATVAAQEKIRVDTDQQKEMDLGNIGLSTALATVPSFGLSTAAGVKRELSAFGGEKILLETKKMSKKAHEEAFGVYSKEVLDSDTAAGKLARDFQKDLNKKSLSETIPEDLAKGKKLREERIAKGQIPAGLDETIIANISAAGARVYSMIPPRLIEEGADAGKRLAKGSKEDLEERFTSRIERGLLGGELKTEEFARVLKEHNITIEQLGYLYAEEVSRAGRILGSQGRISKEASKQMLKTMHELDAKLLDMGSFTSTAKRRLNEETGVDILGVVGKGVRHLDKARIGLMTIQFATTARNTTNGYMRNYVYGLDNLGAGVARVVAGGAKLSTVGIFDTVAREEAGRAVRAGVAQLRTGAQSMMMKDLWLNTTSVTTDAAVRLLKDTELGNNAVAKELFKEMGDIGSFTDADGGLVAAARWLNGLNTMSDNMFKRAIFSRELDRLIFTQTGESLETVLKEGKFPLIDNKLIAEAANEALEFTYQTGRFKGREGIANDVFDTVIKVFSTPGLSAAVPFPRYLVNQLRFWYEHMPVLGMVNMGGILNKPGKKGTYNKLKLDADSFGKQITGGATLFAFLQMRANLGDESTGAFEYNYPEPDQGYFAQATGVGGTGFFDARASLGPFAMFAAVADVLYRMMPHLDEETYMFTPQNPDVAKGIGASTRDLVYALTGGLGRAGTGANIIDAGVDIAINGLDSGDTMENIMENFVEFAGDLVNSTTVGAGVIKDMVATVDPDFRKVPDNTDVSLMGYFMKQATRSFPQTYDKNLDGLYTPFGYYKGLGPEREGYTQIPTRSTGIDVVNPILKQLTGLTEQQERTAVERELSRLRFDFVEITPKRIRMDKPFTNEARGIMGKYVEREIASYIQSDTYLNSGMSDVEKRIALDNRLSEFQTKARAMVLDPNRATSDEEVNRIHRAMFYNLSRKDRQILNHRYRDILRKQGWTADTSEEITGALADDGAFVRAFAILEDMRSSEPDIHARFERDYDYVKSSLGRKMSLPFFK